MSAHGLWTLAWRRLRADRVGMAALAVVLAFLSMTALSAGGLIAADWEAEVGVPYAPPGFVGAGVWARPEAPGAAAAGLPDNPFDPLADDLRALRAQLAAQRATAAERLPTLPFGGDKWGHDVIRKTVKGGETSIMVGCVTDVAAAPPLEQPAYTTMSPHPAKKEARRSERS